MENVTKKRCVGCKTKSPSFNYKGEKPEYCKNCKNGDMIDVKHKRCIECKKKQCCFGLEGSKPEYCIDCKTDEMVDLKNKKCVECKKGQPSFNFENEMSPLYCGNCKKENMINFTEKRICIVCKEVQATNGYADGKRTHCASCKLDDMDDIAHNKCIMCDIQQPSYGFKGEKPKCCFKCKEYDMINLVSQTCKTPSCPTLVSNKYYKGYCSPCFYNEFPEHKKVRYHKIKENKVANYIKINFPDYDWQIDKKIIGGKSLRRPDICLNLTEYYIIIEIDEYQHKKYGQEYDDMRNFDLLSDVNNKPIVLIRFNPDTYIDINKKKKLSCFTVDLETGSLKIKNEVHWEKRLETLKSNVAYWLNKKSNIELTTISLFFDGYDENQDLCLL